MKEDLGAISGSKATPEARPGLHPPGCDPGRLVRLAPDYVLGAMARHRSINAWERGDGTWLVAVGPISDLTRIARCETEEEANFIVAAVWFLLEANGEHCRSAIAMETRRAETGNTGSVAKP